MDRGAGVQPRREVDLSGFGYEVISKIGQGHSASASIVRNADAGEMLVAKCVSLEALSDRDQELACQEAVLLQELRHPCIVRYQDSFLVEGANLLVIVMEYCSGGDLRKAISSKASSGGHFSEDQVMTWFVQILLALQYFHSHKVLHRDLKTSNIFIDQTYSTVKVGDFGVSRVLECTQDAAVTMVGTPYYMSPEVCRNAPYSWKSDVWSLGCVLYELCVLKHAFESSSLLGLVYKIVSDHYEPIPASFSSELNDLVCRLLTKSADSRPSVDELLASPYVKSYLDRQRPLAATPAAPDALPPGRTRRTLCAGEPRAAGRGAQQATGAPAAADPPESFDLDEKARVLLLASRIRRRLAAQRLNWVSALAPFDDDGDGVLARGALEAALLSLGLGLSGAEAAALVAALAPTGGGRGGAPLSGFEAKLVDAFVSAEVQRVEAWARRSLEPLSSRVAVFLRERDGQLRGLLPVAAFRAALAELLPGVTEDQLDVLTLLAGKSREGEVDYMSFADAFGAPPPPPLPDCCSPSGSLLGEVAPPPGPPESETPRSLFTAAPLGQSIPS
uniref:non-specific serine/threonine protein kinase n=1 Tax=Alexandrium monilatum TaxID=311494 RepID=A0A7S4Q9Q7_9DINO